MKPHPSVFKLLFALPEAMGQMSKSLKLYRGLLRAVRHYPSKKKDEIAVAIKQGKLIAFFECNERAR